MRRIELLPAVVVLHAFLIQTHVSYLPCATVLLVVAVGVGMLGRDPLGQRAPTRALGLALCAGVLAWLPPLLVEFGDGPSNMLAIARHFFTSAGATPNSIGFALAYGSTKLQAPILRAFGVAGHVEEITAISFGALQFVLLVAGAFVARAKKDAHAFACCVLGLTGVLMCHWSCRYLGQARHEYLTLWFAVVGMFAWLGVALALLPTTKWSSSTKLEALGLASAVAVLGVVAAVDMGAVWSRHRRAVDRTIPVGQHIIAAAAGVEVLLRSDPGRYAVSALDGKSWGLLAGVTLELMKRGIAPTLQGWRFMFGGGLRYVEPAAGQPALLLSTQRGHSALLLDSFGPGAHLYVRSKPSSTVAGVLSVLQAVDVKGDAQIVVDGKSPPEGSGWSSPGALVLRSRNSSLSLTLPDMRGLDAQMDGVRISADGNDEYEIRVSEDGVHFASLGTVPSLRQKGLRFRDFYFNDDRAWSVLQILPKRGDKRFSVAEVTPIIGARRRPVSDPDALGASWQTSP